MMLGFRMFRRQPPSSPSRATVLHRRASLKFSKTGIVYIGMMLFMGVAAINSQANLLFGMFGLMIGVLLISGVISRLVLRGLSLHRALPDHACVGEPITVSYQVTNTKKFWPSLSVVLAELDGVEGFTKQPHCFLLHAAPQVTASIPALLIPKRRGLHTLNRYQLITSFPFGFVKRSVIGRQKSELLVYPPLAEVSRKLLAICRSADNTGEMSRPQPGGADEFYGVKEYRAGDNPRWIYWRRSARSGTLVSKEMTRVSPPRVLLMVDTFVPARTLDEHALVERVIAMAGSLAAAALDQGLSVGLCAWDAKWVLIPPMRGKRHKADLLSFLARLPLNTSHEPREMVRHVRPALKNGTTPVLFTPHDESLGVEDVRGGLVAVPADSHRARTWFNFDPQIDFLDCMPVNHEPLSDPNRR
jgi:uncharacterized protein (DUF58 family)